MEIRKDEGNRPFAERSGALTQPRSLTYYKWGLAAGWTVVIVVLLAINLTQERSQAIETARTQARSNYERDVVYRHWNAMYGAVYVPVSEKIQPNPYLADHPERDVTTDRGVKLTLINPSYMSRLVLDMVSQSCGVKGHITSLLPLRPQNLPDKWETSALRTFSGGAKEVSSVEEMEGGSYLRLMKPLMTERECLACHGKQGYRVGEIRGGLSVAVPMAPLWGIAIRNYVLNGVSFIILWGLGLVGIFTGARSLTRTIRERDEAERGMVALNRDLLSRTVELESANRELDSFCSTVSHDLRSPLTAINGFCHLLRETSADNRADADLYTGIILNSTKKMGNIITTLLSFSRVTQDELACSTVDLSLIAGEISAELRMQDLKRNAVFTIAEGMTVKGDDGLLRVVMQNLIGNAWKYTGRCLKARIEVGVVAGGDRAVYFVRDNGIGFDNSQSDRMFEAFRRLPNASEFDGTGIGLATVKRIINRHGGQISCEGEPGKGATFYFTLC